MATNNSTNTSNPISATQGGTGLNTYNQGDTLYASASNTLSALAISATPGQYLESNGTIPQYFNWLKEVRIFDDFVTATSGSALSWVASNSAGDFNVPVGGDAGHPGQVQLSTSTSTTGISWYYLNGVSSNGAFILGGGALDIYFVFKLSALSTNTDRYQFGIGFGDGKNGPAPLFANGVYFQYSDNLNSGNWQLIGASSSVLTTTNSSTAFTTSWTTVRININAAATLATFYVGGVSIGTVNSNIPTSNVTPFITLCKTAGTTPILANIDLFYLYQSLTNSR